MTITLDPTTAVPTFRAILAETEQGTLDTLQLVASVRQAHAERQSTIADRLAVTLGEDNERVLVLRRSADISRLLSKEMTRLVTTITTVTAPPAGSSTFTGRVTDASGAAVPGVKVRLSDRTGALQVAESAVTNDLGEFSLFVPANTIAPSTDLAIIVEDSSNRVPNLPPTPVRLEPGVLQRVDVTAAIRP